MTPQITPEMLFVAFCFAALCFAGMALHYRKIPGKMSELQAVMASLRNELQVARKDLAAANVGREKLQASIDRLILRRDDLMKCLNAARDDKERVACILRLMGDDGHDD